MNTSEEFRSLAFRTRLTVYWDFAERGRWAAAMKTLMSVWLLLLSACASAPTPHCIPPDLNRAPEASGGFGPVPHAGPGAEEEYARCKEREADERLEAKLREDEARAKKREAEQLERELRETQGQDKPEPQKPEQDK